MNPSYYKLTKSLGKYVAIRVSSISNKGYSGEISNLGMDQYNDGSFEANIYIDGEPQDIEINGWCFSYHIDGTYHYPGSYKITSYQINAIDPKGEETILYNTPYYTLFSEPEILCSFMDQINMYSNFKDGKTAVKFYQLTRCIEGRFGTWRSVDSALFDYNTGVVLTKEFFTFYKNKGGDFANNVFKKIVKETVNSAVEKFGKDIEEYRIE